MTPAAIHRPLAQKSCLTFGGAALSAEMIMKHTLKVYKNSPDYHAFLRARSNKENSGQSFEWAGHRWAYEVTSFDDIGDYDLLYRFDDQPYPEEISVSSDDMTLRDYFAAKAMQAMIAAHEPQGAIPGWAYEMADEMLRAREVP
ncbi:MAG: hypothetical protein [Bacteriophage sp.]|nr:MAG: hypothetical protein [Bacteriophage sp.]